MDNFPAPANVNCNENVRKCRLERARMSSSSLSGSSFPELSLWIRQRQPMSMLLSCCCRCTCCRCSCRRQSLETNLEFSFWLDVAGNGRECLACCHNNRKENSERNTRLFQDMWITSGLLKTKINTNENIYHKSQANDTRVVQTNNNKSNTTNILCWVILEKLSKIKAKFASNTLD